MANEHDEVERTEAPSPRWLTHARERGALPRSTELMIACSILAGVVAVHLGGGALAVSFREAMQAGLVGIDIDHSPGVSFFNAPIEIVRPLIWSIPFLLAPFLAAILVGLTQVGIRFQPENCLPNLGRFNAAQRVGAILSGRHAVESFVAVSKWIVLASLAGWWLWGDITHLVQSTGDRTLTIVELAGGAIMRLATKIAVALVVFGVIDFARVWWSHQLQSRMTRAELLAELRESEGDPIIRRRRRTAQMDRSLAKWQKKADIGNVVLLGKGRLAVSLRVSPPCAATMVAKAVGTLADRLQRSARAKNVRVVRHNVLAQTIFRECRPGEALPSKLSAGVEEFVTSPVTPPPTQFAS